MGLETIPVEEAYKRLDSCLAALTPLSRSRVQTLIESEQVWKNGKSCRSKDPVKAGDVLTYELPETRDIDLVPEEIPLDIVYEDEDICILNKPRGLVVHPAPGHERGTLVNGLMYHFGNLSTIGGENRPGIVHRIDRMTSGLLAVAKNDMAHQNLAAQFACHSAGRSYVALVMGNIREDTGTINAPIGRHPVDRKRMAVVDNGRPAITHFQVWERFGSYTLLELHLETGRTHQIRVHLAYKKHPLLGDTVYGGADPYHLEGQALHGYKLELTHPRTGEPLKFTVPMPPELMQVLKKLQWTGAAPVGAC